MEIENLALESGWTQDGMVPEPPIWGIRYFSRFGLSIKSWKLDPSPLPHHKEFGILADLDFTLKAKSWVPTPTEKGI